MNPCVVLDEIEIILNDPKRPLKDAWTYLRIYSEMIYNIDGLFTLRDDARELALRKILLDRMFPAEKG